jgi:hypothetical protein
MRQNNEKLEPLIKDLFPPGKPDLGFGLYCDIHAKSAGTEVGVVNTATDSEGPE